jgi:hypothetical protein
MAVASIERWSSGWWFRCVIAGLIGGVAMAAYLMLVHGLGGPGAWYPINVIGAMVPAYRPPGVMYASDPSLSGAFLHLFTSAVWGALYGFLLMYLTPRQNRSPGRASLVGLGWGVVFYLFSGLVIGPALDPAIAQLNPVHWAIAHLIYGVVTGLSLHALVHEPTPTILFAPPEPVDTGVEPGRLERTKR